MPYKITETYCGDRLLNRQVEFVPVKLFNRSSSHYDVTTVVQYVDNPPNKLANVERKTACENT